MGSAPGLKLLLDTHIWLWSQVEPARLGSRLASALEDPDVELWLSPISVWEALILVRKGRVAAEGNPSVWLGGLLAALPLRDAPLTREVALRSRSIDLPQQDPADRFIAASAAVHDLTLATADERLLACGEYSTLPNR